MRLMPPADVVLARIDAYRRERLGIGPLEGEARRQVALDAARCREEQLAERRRRRAEAKARRG